MRNRRNFLLGTAAIAAMAAFSLLVALVLAGSLGGEAYRVTAVFDRAGQLLDQGGDVKLRGVLVGAIDTKVVAPDGTATIVLAMDPSQPVPANVTAAIRGKTLFGEKFIELRDTDGPPEGLLADGDLIPLERTLGAFELEDVFDRALPLLEEVEPGDLRGLLRALAEGVAGQEQQARRALDNGLVALQNLNRNSANLSALLGGLDESSDALSRASPELVEALRQLDAFNRTIVANSSELEGALQNTPEWLDIAGQIMEVRLQDLLDISIKGADILDLASEHRGRLPFTVEALRNFTQAWVTNMSVGCVDASGSSIGEVHPELAGSTCWQVWNLSAENPKSPGAYSDADQPKPDSATAGRAYRAQLRTLLRVPFPDEVSDLSSLLYSPVRDHYGLIPEELL